LKFAMKRSATFVLLVLLSASLLAQRSYNETFRFAEQRINLEEQVPREAQLFFPEYIAGEVFFHDGQVHQGRLNFNMLLDEVVHLDRRGQERVTGGQIDSVRFENGVVFVNVPDHGFMEQILEHSRAALYGRHFLRVNTETMVRGPYGQPNRSSAVTRVRSLDTGSGDAHERHFYLENPGDAPMDVNVRYQSQFLIRHGQEFHRAGSRRQLQGIFPEYRQQLRAYLRDHDLSFSDPEDMKALTDFINSL
jgi:hypothetical protein